MKSCRTSREWLSIISECRNSGQSDKAWCREHGISISAFYYNIRKLRRLACEIPDPAATEAHIQSPQEVVQLRISNTPAPMGYLEHADCYQEARGNSITISTGDIIITCPDGTSHSMICSVIQALRTTC